MKSTEPTLALTALATLMVAEVENYDGSSIQSRSHVETVGTPSGPISRGFREETVGFWRPSDYEPMQPADLPVLRDHDPRQRIGSVVYLSWSGPPDRITAVCEIDQDVAVERMAAGECYVSPGTKAETRGAHNYSIKLDHLGLVEQTARIAARPVRWTGTSYEERYARWTSQTTVCHGLLCAADDARRSRKRGEAIPIVGHPDLREAEPRLFSDDRYAHDPHELYTTAKGGSWWQDQNGMHRTADGYELFYSSPAGSRVLRVR